jgi:hypothetical protein
MRFDFQLNASPKTVSSMDEFSRRKWSHLFSSRKRSAETVQTQHRGRALVLESLESRELLAADFAAHHNYNEPGDVDRNFRITPRDALMVIHDLNKFGSRTLDSDYDRSNGAPLMDVDGDGQLNPRDALSIIHQLNSGEGAGEVVEISYDIVDMDGNSLDPNPDDNIQEYQVPLGTEFRIQYRAQDIQSLPAGLFNVVTDIVYRNADDADVEKIEYQWGDHVGLEIGSLANGGTFTLQFNGEQTAPISIPLDGNNRLDRDALAASIKDAVVALSFVDDANDVRVTSNRLKDAADSATRNFDVEFVNGLARQNFPNKQLVDNSLTGSDGNQPVLLFLQANDGGSAVPSDPSEHVEVFLVGADFEDLGNIDNVEYSSGQSGLLQNPSPGTYVLDEFGGLAQQFSLNEPGARYIIAEARFRAAVAGQVLISGAYPSGDGTLLLYDPTTQVPAEQVLFPLNIPLTVVENVLAVDDVYPGAGQSAINEDSATINLDVTANDILSVGSSLSVTNVSSVANATVSIGADNQSVDFTPGADRFGEFTFSYTIENDLGDSSTATVTVNVSPVNDAPTVKDLNYQIVEDSVDPLVITPSEVFDPGPFETTQQVSFVSASPIAGQTNGTVVLNGGNVEYIPAAGFNGDAFFTVIGQDSAGASTSPTTITVAVSEVNDAPIPFEGTLETNEDTALIVSGEVAGIDIIALSAPGPANESTQTLTLTDLGTPSNGVLENTNGVVTYTPNENYFGTDSFTYEITDNGFPELSATGTITVNVAPINDAPTAVDDTGAANFVVLGFAGQATPLDVLRNDSAGPLESSIDTIRVVEVGTPSIGGTVSIAADGLTVNYQPPVGLTTFPATETFTYTIEDSEGLQDTATAEVTIIPPQLPFAQSDSPAAIDEDTTDGTAIDVLANDLVNEGATAELISFTQPANGTVTLDNNNTPNDFSDDRLVYVPNANVFQPDTFTYVLNDTEEGSQPSTGTVTVTFNEQNDAPTSVNRSFTDLTEDTPRTFTAATLLDGMSAGPLEDGVQTLTITNVSIASSTEGSVEIVDGDVVFTPGPDFNGSTQFLLTVSDDGTTSGVADPLSSVSTISLQIAAVNDDPVGGPDNVATAEDTALPISGAALLANDRPGPDTATDELAEQQVSIVAPSGALTSSAGGTVTYDGTDFSYTPAADFNGSDSFTYEISDGVGGTGSAVVTVQVTEVNDAPTATPINRDVFAGLNATLDISSEVGDLSAGPANESDQTVRLVGVRASANTQGTVSLNADGSINYTPPADDSITSDSFIYVVEDNGTTDGEADPLRSESIVNISVLPFQVSSISGQVWVDDNTNGMLDEDELLLGGIQIVLSGTVEGESAPMEPIEKLTLADGSYHFGELGPGTYTVTVMGGAMLIDGDDYAGDEGDLDTLDNQFTIAVAIPGGIQADAYNFSYKGVNANTAARLEQLASSFYSQFPEVRQQGFYAAIDSSGKPSWSIKKDGFEDVMFGEIVLDVNGNLLLTRVDSTETAYTASVPRNKALAVRDDDGSLFVRVLAEQADLNWTEVDPSNPGSTFQGGEHYLASVQAVFAQENWGDDDEE